jgi:hypothetical protein
MQALTNKELANKIRNRMFAERDTLDEALDYAFSIAKATDNPAAVMTAVMVVLNTLANQIEIADTLNDLGVK